MVQVQDTQVVHAQNLDNFIQLQPLLVRVTGFLEPISAHTHTWGSFTSLTACLWIVEVLEENPCSHGEHMT